jgi:uncharacterized protein YdaU (DUF1376 family)
MAKWHEKIAEALKSKHSDTQAVIRSGKRGAKNRTNRRERRMSKVQARAMEPLTEKQKIRAFKLLDEM